MKGIATNESSGCFIRRKAGGRGFTLVELLVVVAIIGVLAGLLVPALAQAKRKAKAVQCLSQLRQLGLGLLMYADSEPDGKLPPDPQGADAPAWVQTLVPQLGSVDGIRICPADGYAEARRRWGRSSYVRNEYTAREPKPVDEITAAPGLKPELTINRATLRLADLARPADTFLAFEGSNLGVQFPPLGLDRVPVPAFDDHTHPDTWVFGWAHVLADIDPYRHGKAANYLHADGHVAAIPAETLRRRLEAGENFAAIPE
jgi:prepilin-type N-terminal cleavage/methylation domain-containing protein/prepilin-type processing-associated H-X9-DG protein